MERARLTRLRWRMRGAWLWPAFVVLTAAEGLLLNALPVWGSGPHGFVPGVLIAGVLNLAVIALAAPLAGRLLRRRRPDLPRAIANDYCGSALLVALAAALLAAGLGHHGEIAAEREARTRQWAAVGRYLAARTPQLRSAFAHADAMRLEPDVYRTCVPTGDPKRWLCLIVDTSQDPAAVTRDRDAAPNAAYLRHGGFD